MAWFSIQPRSSAGVIARTHIEAHDGGQLLPECPAASNLAALQAMMPPGLTFDLARVVGSLPGCIGQWWS